MDLYSERRKHRRFVYEADIAHDLLAQNTIYNGKLYNFSKGGLYFESDQAIIPGEEVFIKFKDQQKSVSDAMMAQLPFGVKVIWQIDLPDSSFRFGYGADYIDHNDSLVKCIKIPKIEQEKLREKNPRVEKDPRAYPRRRYHKSLRLSYKNKNYRGEFQNISRGGVFIKTDIQFTVGNQIRIAIPGSKIHKNLKLKGWIVRITRDGFGAKFDKESDGKDRREIERRSGFDRRAVLNRRA